MNSEIHVYTNYSVHVYSDFTTESQWHGQYNFGQIELVFLGNKVFLVDWK